MPKRVKDEVLRIVPYPVGLRKEQISWINENTNFEINRFIREKLDEYIKQKKEAIEL